jgi:hypothetical protein
LKNRILTDAGRSTINKLETLNLLKLLQEKNQHWKWKDLDEMIAIAMQVKEWKLFGKNNAF